MYMLSTITQEHKVISITVSTSSQLPPSVWFGTATKVSLYHVISTIGNIILSAGERHTLKLRKISPAFTAQILGSQPEQFLYAQKIVGEDCC